MTGVPLPEPGEVLPFGIRSDDTTAGAFDDLIGYLHCTASGDFEHEAFVGTTDPGAYYLGQPLNVNGTAIMVPGYHEDIWVVGRHKGKYRALIQRAGTVRVWRDHNRDTVLDWNERLKVFDGWYGINLHPAGLHNPEKVGRWSAGCQVARRVADCRRLVKVCEETGQDRFSYALFTSLQLEAVRRHGRVPPFSPTPLPVS